MSAGGVVLLTPGIGGGLFSLGYLQVQITPPQVSIAGGGWRLQGNPIPNYYNNDDVKYALLSGNYTSECVSVFGCNTPTNQSINITSSITTPITMSYTSKGICIDHYSGVGIEPPGGVYYMPNGWSSWQVFENPAWPIGSGSSFVFLNVNDLLFVKNATATLHEVTTNSSWSFGQYEEEINWPVVVRVNSNYTFTAMPVFKDVITCGTESFVDIKRSGSSTLIRMMEGGQLCSPFSLDNPPIINDGDEVQLNNVEISFNLQNSGQPNVQYLGNPSNWETWRWSESGGWSETT